MTTNSPEYIEWLKENSMLENAGRLAKTLSGKKEQWGHGFAVPKAREAVKDMPVWFNSYPASTIPFRGQKFIPYCGDARLWRVLRELGVSLLRTGPEKVSGGIRGRETTPTVDGYFDRIKLDISPDFGTDEEYKAMTRTAAEYGGKIAGDIIPGHTGKGYDFRLAERNYGEYPGIYVMVEIDPQDWHLLPEVTDEWESANVHPDNVVLLANKGYLPGNLQRVLFSIPGDTRPLSGWDATAEIEGVDGVTRRWVFLHYFKSGQPTMNWLDPTSAAFRMMCGDMVKTMKELGAVMVRLDANSFLGIEKSLDPNCCWSEGHPLSVNATNSLAMFARKLGGVTFQELNLAVNYIREFGEKGVDLSYDFITRPAVQHAVLTGSADFLKFSYQLMKEYKIEPVSLIHDMQNHDEITYELVHFLDNMDVEFTYKGKRRTGRDIRAEIVREMQDKAINGSVRYNALSGNGLCTTFAGLAATRLGIADLNAIRPEDMARIRRAHLLLAAYNAFQPGVFGLSGWDLVGALPIDPKDIPEFVADGDTRWINRGGYDLLDADPEAEKSIGGLPKAKALYGSVVEQLKDENSFASILKKMIQKRQEFGIHLADLVHVEQFRSSGGFVMAHRLPDGRLQFTALNFSGAPIDEDIVLGNSGEKVVSIMDGKTVAMVGNGKIKIHLEPMEYLAAVVG
ncbi:MAG: maltose alpha-D-glucosyltransferase [Alphaproteobacteria bacterium]|jgi:trehalose synthase